MPRRSPRVQQGDAVWAKELVSVIGHRVWLPDPESAVHLQFQRFAGCPLCNLQLQAMLRRYDEDRCSWHSRGGGVPLTCRRTA
jgi:hypothetical protein